MTEWHHLESYIFKKHISVV